MKFQAPIVFASRETRTPSGESHHPDVSPKAASICRTFTRASSLVGLALGLIALLGWVLDLRLLQSFLPGAATMKPNTALCVLLIATALWFDLRTAAVAPASRSWIAWVCASAGTGIALATFLEYVGGWNLGLDTWLFPEAVRTGDSEFPGRMSHATASGFFLLGLGLLLIDWQIRSRKPAQSLVLSGALIGYIALAGYAFGTHALYAELWFSSVSLPTAALLFSLGFGILCLRPDQGIMAVINSVNDGGWMARRLLPGAILLPLLFGWLVVYGGRTGWFHAEFGLALLVTLLMCAFTVIVWRHARSLNLSEEQQKLSSAARARLAAIVESSQDGIIGVDLNGRVTSWNQGAEALFGYSATEITGESVLRLLPPERQKEETDIFALIRMGETFAHYETVRRRKDGSPVEVSLTVSPVRDAAGTITGASKVARDITLRRKAETDLSDSEERFRQIAENINEVFWITDPTKSKMLYVSPGYEGIWGRPCADLYDSPQIWVESIHSDDRARIDEAARTRQMSREYDEHYRIVRPDGTVRWIHDRAFPVRNATGEIYRIIGLAQDITQQRTLERQLQQAQKLEALGTLAGGIAHDFNNILSAIMGYSELALMTLQEPRAKKLLPPVVQAGQRAADLIRQILAFSRQQEQQRAPVQLRHVVAETVNLLRATIPTTIEIEAKVSGDLPPVLADATQIHQVAMNLGTNAWHAMRDRPAGKLTVSLERFAVDDLLAQANTALKAGPYVRLTITDTGKGMDRKTQDRIFEPFFTTKTPGEGTGLGLSVVHGIIRDHDGTITVYSQPGEGTTFHLYFPALADGTTLAVADQSPVPSGHGQHILFVDDELPLAQLGNNILEHLGYTVETRTDPVEALESVRANPAAFDLVVTDHAMPKLNGVELACALRELRPDLPVILTSGYTGGLDQEQLASAGIRKILAKPHTVRSVGTAVHEVLASVQRET